MQRSHCLLWVLLYCMSCSLLDTVYHWLNSSPLWNICSMLNLRLSMCKALTYHCSWWRTTANQSYAWLERDQWPGGALDWWPERGTPRLTPSRGRKQKRQCSHFIFTFYSGKQSDLAFDHLNLGGCRFGVGERQSVPTNPSVILHDKSTLRGRGDFTCWQAEQSVKVKVV